MLAIGWTGAPLRAEELRRQLDGVADVWAWVHEAPAGEWVRRGDAVLISRGARRGLAIVDEAGLARVAGPHDRRPRVGVVREIFRAHRRRSLDRFPWSVALATAPTWALVGSLGVLVAPLFRLADQLRAPPTEEESDRTQARFYGAECEVTGPAVEGLWQVEERLVERWMRPGDRVLDVGCGTGREAIALAARGMRVLAVDGSPGAIEAARRRVRAAPGVGGELAFECAHLRELELPPASFDAVFLSSDVYASIPGRARRIAALARVRRALRDGGVALVPADLGAGRLGIAIDAPRAALRAIGVTAAEPGDRWIWRGPPPTLLFRHAFAREEDVIRELEAAGLAYVERASSYVVARREQLAPEGSPRSSRPPRSLAREVLDALAALPRVERARRTLGPAPAVAKLRLEAAGEEERDALGRARLRAAIRIADRALPLGGGCYRRALLEIALDRGAAKERLFLGRSTRGGTGHAWLETFAPGEPFEVTFEV